MATKKAAGTAKNLRDSQPKYLGVKKTAGQEVKTGQVIVRQRGTKIEDGKNVYVAKDQVVSTVNSTPSSGKQFVASKNGTKYYLPNCSGAKRIKPENLIGFPSREAAEAAGYGKAANCPGL